MNAYIITMSHHANSLAMSKALKESVFKTESVINLHHFEAVVPTTIAFATKEIFGKNIPWTWQEGNDFKTGLYKRPYVANDEARVVACALSHFSLWKKCADGNESIMVLEHDAKFIRKFDISDLPDNWGALGLNDPVGNTRKGRLFDQKVKEMGEGIHRVPVIDSPNEPPLPMGLAGNSAYIIKPEAAKEVLETVADVGMWPNDAILCRQLFRWLKVINPYYTIVQRGLSTTTKL